MILNCKWSGVLGARMQDLLCTGWKFSTGSSMRNAAMEHETWSCGSMMMELFMWGGEKM